MAPSNPEPPTVPEDVGSTLRTSDPTTETPPQPTATTPNTSSSNVASGTLCSVCSAPTSNRRARKAGAASDGTRSISTQAGDNGLGQHEPELGGDSSDDSEDEELPPPADPNGVSVGKKTKGKLAHKNRPPAQLVDLLGDLQKTDNDKKGAEEEKVVRERASKLEFRRLDELYNKNIHDFYLAESSALSSQKEDKWEEYIFIVRRRFDWQNRYQKTFVDIKSPGLKGLLKEILEGVVGISLVEDKPTVEPNLLFNYLPELTAQLSKHEASENPDTPLISHLKLLIDYIQADYADIQKRLFPMLANSEISFELLWALFLPNSLIYTIDPGSDEDRLLKLDWAELRETVDRGKFYQLECHYVDFDGKIFGEATCTLDIPEFRGVRKIEQLGVYPIQYHNTEDALRQRLIERGKKFCELKGMHYRMYQGNAYYKKKKGFVKVNIDGRVMIDPLTFRRINPNYRLAPVKDFDAGTAKPHRADDDDFDDCCGGVIGGGGGGDGGLGGDDDDDDDFNSAAPAAPAATSTNRLKSALRSAAARRRYTIDELGKVRLVANSASTTVVPGRPNAGADGEHEGDKNPENMTEEDLLLCSPTVLGFSFSDKLWVELAVSNISDIEWNAGAFDSLVLPEAQKRIVRALVESHTKQSAQNKGGFDDFIKGKGKGLVAVLHGRPGVGKTLTAEGISEYLKRPLYCVGAGELGTDPRTLEQQLGRILDVAHVWGAVLLLDEADVFLERRSVHDLHRNALVSIFLRLLEYFQGILFLTTNRVETFDEAFQSRIHIALRYSDLDRKAKKQIWNSFLNIVARDEVSDAPADSAVSVREVVTKEELENLARRELNGRQIKNVVRTAQALAQNKGEKLGMSHLREVLDVTEGFERDLKGTGQLEGMMSYA